MPLYVYRAMTEDGHVVRNRVEDTNKHSLIKKIKRNGLLPISVTELKGKQNRTKKNKRNVKDIDSMMKNLNTGNILNRQKNKKKSVLEKIGYALVKSNKITNRDLVIFTQNFYLLKKANFNNIHALNTIIESTENPKFKEILEDILAGVEARRKYVFNNGILSRRFSVYLYKYDKSWRIIRFFNKFFTTGSKIFGWNKWIK